MIPAPAPVLRRCGSCQTLEEPFKKHFPCSGCHIARYCNKRCQKAHWSIHKPYCQSLGVKNFNLDSIKSYLLSGCQLIIAVEAGMKDIGTLSHFLALGYDLNAGREQVTLLHIAAGAGLHKVVKWLCEQPSIEKNLQTTNKQQSTPLHYAVDSNDFLTVQALLAYDDLDINRVDGQGVTAFFSGVVGNKIHAVEALYGDPRTDINICPRHAAGFLVNPLAQTLFPKVNIPMAQLLCRDPNRINLEYNSCNLLFLALLPPGSRKDITPQTPEWFKIIYSQVKAVHAQAKLFGESFMLRAAYHENLEIVRFLCEQKADINEPNEFRRTPIWKAARSGHRAIVECLLGYAANFRQADDCEKKTPLYIASRNGHFEVVELLIQAYQRSYLGLSLWKPNDIAAFVAAYRIAETMGYGDIMDLFMESNSLIGLSSLVAGVPGLSLASASAVVPCLTPVMAPDLNLGQLSLATAVSLPPPIELSVLQPSAMPMRRSSSVSMVPKVIAKGPRRNIVAIKFTCQFEGYALILFNQRINAAKRPEGICLHPLEMNEQLIGYFAVSPDVVQYFAARNETEDLTELLNASCVTREHGQDGFKLLPASEKFKKIAGRMPAPHLLGNQMKYRKNKIRILSEKIPFSVLTRAPNFQKYFLFWFCGVAEKQGQD